MEQSSSEQNQSTSSQQIRTLLESIDQHLDFDPNQSKQQPLKNAKCANCYLYQALQVKCHSLKEFLIKQRNRRHDAERQFEKLENQIHLLKQKNTRLYFQNSNLNQSFEKLSYEKIDRQFILAIKKKKGQNNQIFSNQYYQKINCQEDTLEEFRKQKNLGDKKDESSRYSLNQLFKNSFNVSFSSYYCSKNNLTLLEFLRKDSYSVKDIHCVFLIRKLLEKYEDEIEMNKLKRQAEPLTNKKKPSFKLLYEYTCNQIYIIPSIQNGKDSCEIIFGKPTDHILHDIKGIAKFLVRLLHEMIFQYTQINMGLKYNDPQKYEEEIARKTYLNNYLNLLQDDMAYRWDKCDELTYFHIFKKRIDLIDQNEELQIQNKKEQVNNIKYPMWNSNKEVIFNPIFWK